MSFYANCPRNFTLALDDGADPFERDPGKKFSLFELACLTSGKHEFIRACIEWRSKSRSPVDVNEIYQTTKKCAIHLAALSRDARNLSALLECGDVLVDKLYKDRTALYLLFEEITPDNWESSFANIKLLLEHGAEINATNEEGVSALACLLDDSAAWRKTILEHCLTNCQVNVHSRGGQLRRAIVNRFPTVTIPELAEDVFKGSKLKRVLINGSDGEFVAEYEKFCSESKVALPQDKRLQLLFTAVQKKKLHAAKILMGPYFTDGHLTSPTGPWYTSLLETCCTYGGFQMLEWLLKIIPASERDLVNQSPLLPALVKQMANDKESGNDAFLKCMRVLLAAPQISVDQRDAFNCTALHLAARFGLDDAVKLLLASGAYLGGKNVLGVRPVAHVNPSLLERHLDACVTEVQPGTGDPGGYTESNAVKIDFSNFVSGPPGNDDEMALLMELARSAESRQLLRHPVVATILVLKWRQLGRCFYANTLLCAFFSSAFLTYVAFYYGQDTDGFGRPILYALSWLGVLYLTIRETVQLLTIGKAYCRCPVNLVEVALIVTSTLVLIPWLGDASDELRRLLSVAVIGLTTIEFALLLGTLPLLSISTHMVMLRTVARHFLMLLALYSVFLVPFAFAFYVVYRPSQSAPPATVPDNRTDTADDVLDQSTTCDGAAGEGNDSFNRFEDISLALLKTVVMFTGEFEAANLELHQSVLRYILFASFLFLVYAVLFNVMNGVAVGDTAAIQTDAELIGIVEKVSLVGKYEKQLKALRRWHKYGLHKLRPLVPVIVVPRKCIIIQSPHQSNAITYPEEPPRSEVLEMAPNRTRTRHAEAEGLLPSTEGITVERTQTANRTWGPLGHGYMDGKVIKYALDILRRKKVTSTDSRLAGIEMNIIKLAHGQRELRELLIAEFRRSGPVVH